MSDRDMESIISSAMIDTEKEIAGDAWGDEEIAHDETGNRALEAMGDGLEGQHEPDDDEEETEGQESDDGSEGESEAEEGEGEEAEGDKPPAKTEPEAKPPKAEEPPKGRVPSAQLRESNERARAAESARDTLKAQLEAREADFKRQLDALTARIDSLARPQQQQPPAETKPPAAPDLWEDPNAFFAQKTEPLAKQIEQLSQAIVNQRFENSMAMAHSKHGEVFEKAFAAINTLDPKNPDDRVTVQRIYASPNQGEALVAWHKRSETLREVGDDPGKYRERVAAETREKLMKDPDFRKQLIEELRGEAAIGDDGRPRTTVRLPKSLNGTPGGNRRAADPSEFDDSDQAVAESAWR